MLFQRVTPLLSSAKLVDSQQELGKVSKPVHTSLFAKMASGNVLLKVSNLQEASSEVEVSSAQIGRIWWR